MKMMEERILQEAAVLPGNIIKVDGILNHRVDIFLIRSIAKEFKRIFKDTKPSIILTAEASGIAIATLVANEFNLPFIFAKKAKSSKMQGALYKSDIYSYTYEQKVTLFVEQKWLTKDSRVLIIDDFLARGEALRGLIDIVKQSGATVSGIGIVIEKTFQKGGDEIRGLGYNICSLAEIESLDNGNIKFRHRV